MSLNLLRQRHEGSKAAPIRPRTIRLEASTACQLQCPSCPTTHGKLAEKIGTGFLGFDTFKALIDNNPWVTDVELSNWGEICLSPDLLSIIEYAHGKNVARYVDSGVNLSTVREDVREALVRYKFRRMTCSIDGATSETYSLYRKRRSFERVIENITRTNHLKVEYGTRSPKLLWQFIAFDHNEHEIPVARQMAEDLAMRFL